MYFFQEILELWYVSRSSILLHSNSLSLQLPSNSLYRLLFQKVLHAMPVALVGSDRGHVSQLNVAQGKRAPKLGSSTCSGQRRLCPAVQSFQLPRFTLAATSKSRMPSWSCSVISCCKGCSSVRRQAAGSKGQLVDSPAVSRIDIIIREIVIKSCIREQTQNH